jgi:predicted aspartyl protease
LILAGGFEAGCPEIPILLEKEPTPRKVLLDTGFNGELMVPERIAADLGWQPIGVLDYQSASGVATAVLYEGRILWFGVSRRVSAMATPADVLLVGMELLHDCTLTIHRASGQVRVTQS